MRTASLTCFAFLAFGSVLAEEANVIEWETSSQLTWSDFAGPVPRGTEEQRVAATAGSLAWTYEYKVQWSRNTCLFTIDNISARALFHGDRSWVRPEHRTDAVLLHEQGHFDILELYKRSFHTETRGFLGATRPCQGRSERSASRDTHAEIDRLVGSVYDEIWRAYRLRQESYDDETRHGTDVDAQAAWTARIEMLLETGGEL